MQYNNHVRQTYMEQHINKSIFILKSKVKTNIQNKNKINLSKTLMCNTNIIYNFKTALVFE